MAVRQYIGARYVTKIYENSLDPSSAEWEANVNYEPLTMVTFNNGSYLSKKDVPASIGDPASNPSYWVQTGFYNGQIASLQSQIDTINLELTNLEISQDVLNFVDKYAGKSICIYGDSLSANDTGNWTEPFMTLMTAIGSTVTKHCVAGGDMTDMVNYSAADTNTYDFVLIWVGVNDANNGTPLGAFNTSGTFSYKYVTLLTNIRANSPSAQIFDFGLTYFDRVPVKLMKSEFYYDNCLQQISAMYGVTFKTMLGLPNNGFAYNVATSDGIHFTEAYSKSVILNTIIKHMLTDNTVISPNTKIFIDTATLTPTPDVSIVMNDSWIDTDGHVHVCMLIDVANDLNTYDIVDLGIGAVPDQTIYHYSYSPELAHGSLFAITTAGKIVNGDYLKAGRYYFSFDYIPTYALYYFGN